MDVDRGGGWQRGRGRGRGQRRGGRRGAASGRGGHGRDDDGKFTPTTLYGSRS